MGDASTATTDKATKVARIRAHTVFDLIWKRRLSKRHEAYTWMRKAMGLSRSQAHISQLSIEQCALLVSLVYRDYPSLVTRYARISLGADL